MSKERINLTNEAIKINGSYIEDLVSGYATLNTSGRENLEKSINSFEVGTANGSVIKSARYGTRTITVEFLITGTDSSDLIAKLNQLQNILSQENADCVFNDEPDKYFVGTPIFSEAPEKGRTYINGKWQLFCADPFKYSLTPIVKSTDDESGVSIVGNTATFTFDYNGTYECHPTLQASFASAKSSGAYNEDGDCGYVAWMDKEKNIIQLGNPDALDIDQYTRATQLANQDFSVITGWTGSGWSKTWGDKTISGSVSSGNVTDTYWNNGTGAWSASCAKPTYGTSTGWHGPLLWKSTSGAINFNVNLVQRFCCNGGNEVGTFECGIYNTSSTPYMVAGYVLDKSSAGTTATVRYIVNGKQVGTDSIDVSYYNTHFGYCRRDPVYTTYSSTTYYTNKKKTKKSKKKTKYYKTTYTTVCTGYTYTQSNLNSSIKKNEGTITFKVGNCSAKTFNDASLSQIAGHNISMHFGASGTSSTLDTNVVKSVSFTNNGNDNKTFAAIPNVFTAGDVVEANCNDASVYVMRENTVAGQYAPQYGALGNNWEGFKLVKGQNVISCSWSDWVNVNYKPTIKIIYNEVFI